MKRTVIAALAAAGILMATTHADARPRPQRGEKFQSNKTFGLGLMIGAPTAISGKYFLGPSTALDFGVGAYYQYRGDGLHIHGDFLWHPVNLTKTADFWLPLYFGVGARYFEHGREDRFDDHGHFGVRVPLGISMDFNNVPLDIFFELALSVDLIIFEDYDDDFRTDLGGALGIRYWF